VTVLLHKANELRRPAWRVETSIVDDGGLRVVKRASGDPVDGELGTLAERHRRLSRAQQVVGLPRVLRSDATAVEVEYVAGETSLARLERCLYERRFAAAQLEIDTVLRLLRQMPAIDVDAYAADGFVAAFDPERRARGAPIETCLLPGLYDFGLGNLVISPGASQRIVVDWEWTFPWPVPLAFVGFVSIRNAAEYLQPLIRALTSEALPGLIFYDDVVIPEGWAQAAGLDRAGVRRFLALEASFQDWLHVMHHPFERYDIHPDPRRVTRRQDENAALLVNRLETELAATRAIADAALEQARAKDTELVASRRIQADLSGLRYSAAHLRRLVVRRLRGDGGEG
jgi:hypothetical protein